MPVRSLSSGKDLVLRTSATLALPPVHENIKQPIRLESRKKAIIRRFADGAALFDDRSRSRISAVNGTSIGERTPRDSDFRGDNGIEAQ